jgi:hypothetical protein
MIDADLPKYQGTSLITKRRNKKHFCFANVLFGQHCSRGVVQGNLQHCIA